MTPPLMLLGSGLGWMLMLRDAASAHLNIVSFLWHLPYSYT
jgi:hypothetical protein